MNSFADCRSLYDCPHLETVAHTVANMYCTLLLAQGGSSLVTSIARDQRDPAGSVSR